MQCNMVRYGTVLTDYRRILTCTMDHDKILDVGPLTDYRAAVLTSDRDIDPDR